MVRVILKQERLEPKREELQASTKMQQYQGDNL